jgi:hypothetical protein
VVIGGGGMVGYDMVMGKPSSPYVPQAPVTPTQGHNVGQVNNVTGIQQAQDKPAMNPLAGFESTVEFMDDAPATSPLGDVFESTSSPSNFEEQTQPNEIQDVIPETSLVPSEMNDATGVETNIESNEAESLNVAPDELNDVGDIETLTPAQDDIDLQSEAPTQIEPTIKVETQYTQDDIDQYQSVISELRDSLQEQKKSYSDLERNRNLYRAEVSVLKRKLKKLESAAKAITYDWTVKGVTANTALIENKTGDTLLLAVGKMFKGGVVESIDLEKMVVKTSLGVIKP